MTTDLSFKDFHNFQVKEHHLQYNDHYNSWVCLDPEDKRITSATTKTECFLKALKIFKGTHNFVHYGDRLTPEEEERDMRNACRMHFVDKIIEEVSV